MITDIALLLLLGVGVYTMYLVDKIKKALDLFLQLVVSAAEKEELKVNGE